MEGKYTAIVLKERFRREREAGRVLVHGGDIELT